MVAAGISRFASLLDSFFQDRFANPVLRNIVQEDLETGYHRNPTDNPTYFTDAYLHRPEVLSSEVVEAGFQHQATLAVQGPAWLFESFKNYWADPNLRDTVFGFDSQGRSRTVHTRCERAYSCNRHKIEQL